MATDKKQKFSDSDRKWMERTLELAREGIGLTSPNPMVGAVLVRDGKVIGEGYHHGPGLPHAEVEAVQAAKGNVAGATLYVNLEPCNHFGRTPPCAPMLIEKKIARVVAADSDPNATVAGQGFRLLKKAGIRVDVGLMEAEARHLNEAFYTFHTLKRPFMIMKWAMTLDGRIASMTGQSKWISNEKSRMYVHEIRSNVDAVMIGIGTVLQDNPMLNVRLTNYKKRQPKRIIVDGNLRIPVRAQCLVHANPGEVVIATSESAPVDKIERLRGNGHHVLVLKGRRGLIDLRQLIGELPAYDIQSVLCEGGSSMHGSLLESRLVDRIIAFIAPKVIGGEGGKSPIIGWGLPDMSKALRLQNLEIRQFDNDICMEGYVSDEFRDLKPLKNRLIPRSTDQGKKPPLVTA